VKVNEIMSIPKSSPESSSVSAPVGLHGKPQPPWLAPIMAGMHREKIRMREELGRLKGALPLLMKQRNGGCWTPEERLELRAMLRAASAVSPYLLIWVLPGSVFLLPLLAWHLDTRRKRREAKKP